MSTTTKKKQKTFHISLMARMNV